jgi:hypothetical protein
VLTLVDDGTAYKSKSEATRVPDFACSSRDFVDEGLAKSIQECRSAFLQRSGTHTD